MLLMMTTIGELVGSVDLGEFSLEVEAIQSWVPLKNRTWIRVFLTNGSSIDIEETYDQASEKIEEALNG